jgi:hypothetical protein
VGAAYIELGGGMFGRVEQSAVGVHRVSCGSATSYTPIESNGARPSKCV